MNSKLPKVATKLEVRELRNRILDVTGAIAGVETALEAERGAAENQQIWRDQAERDLQKARDLLHQIRTRIRGEDQEDEE